jgi:heme oxygenase
LGVGLEAALGSLYVMEGSTLGGQVISRILDRSPDLIGRVRYFDPYGPRTGAMWRAFRAGLRGRVAAGADRRSIVAAAVQTFELLEDWLIRPEQGLRDGRSVR